MATLIPDTPKKCSHSERGVYERLGRELPDDWIVLHSLGLPGHEKKIWGEADIVILSSTGVFALEVKGGEVSCKDGIWHFESPGYPGYKKNESPWAQASGAMSAIKKKLCDEEAAFKHTLFGFGVVMPRTAFTASGAELIQDVLIDKRSYRQKFPLHISRLERYWSAAHEEKHGRSYCGLTREQISRARQILRPDLETTLSIGSWLTGVDEELLYLTNEQIRSSRRMAANPRTIVRGKAGTGKSIIAAERARQLSDSGKRVLYLCYNQLLASHVRQSLARDDRAKLVDVWHAHGLYHDLITGAGLGARLGEEDPSAASFFSETFPQLASDALCIAETPAWDALIVDEAQDLLTSAHLDVFDLLVKDGLQHGHWHLFLDPNQAIYAEEEDDVYARLKAAHPAYDDLFQNCRNTREVAIQASIISGIDLELNGAPKGLPCPPVYYSTLADCVAKLSALIDELLSRDVRLNDIAILSTRKRVNSLLKDVTHLGGRVLASVDDPANAPGAIVFSTMHAFKGLERQVIITVDMEDIGETHRSMLHYAGHSRARALLYAFLPETRTNAYEVQAARFGERLVERRDDL